MRKQHNPKIQPPGTKKQQAAQKIPAGGNEVGIFPVFKGKTSHFCKYNHLF
nr:hypothetical protein [uncultured Kingella sp.]